MHLMLLFLMLGALEARCDDVISYKSAIRKFRNSDVYTRSNTASKMTSANAATTGPSIEMNTINGGRRSATGAPVLVDSDESDGCATCMCQVFGRLCCLVTFPFSVCLMFKSVQEYERAVIFRLGRIKHKKAVGPGVFTVNPITDSIRVIDLRVRTFYVPPQDVLTRDGVAARVDAVVYYKVHDPIAAIKNVADYDKSAQLLAQTALRNCLGTKTLSELLTEREAIIRMMRTELDEATEHWGVDVERVELKDVQLPQDMRKTMAAEAEAQREARAKMIAADGEQRAARSLKEAADIMNESPITVQLRYLQTLREVASDRTSTIVFPVPIELMNFAGKMGAMPFPITDAAALQNHWKNLTTLPNPQ